MIANVATVLPWHEAPADAEAAAYDRLPRPVRRALADSMVKWSALDLWRECAVELAIGDIATVLRFLRQAEAWERQEFNAAHLARYGCELPHVAAGVAPLRTGIMPILDPALFSARSLAA